MNSRAHLLGRRTARSLQCARNMVGRRVMGIALVVSMCSGAGAVSAMNEAGVQSWGPRPLRMEGPACVLGAGFGVAHFQRIENASDLGLGPVFDARIGVQLLTWAAVDARFWVMRHQSIGSVVVHAESIEARLSFPAKLRPYVAAGIARYDVVAYDGDSNLAASPDAAGALPMSAGLEALLGDSLAVQAETTYWFLFGHGLSSRHVALASVWGATLGGRYYF